MAGNARLAPEMALGFDLAYDLIGELLAGGFQMPYLQQQANLEDVYLQISGKKCWLNN